jgi:hypothetical protein
MMNRKLLFPVLTVLLLAALTSSPSQAAKSYYAERYDVTIAVQPDGALIVTETVVFRFEGGPFTYVFRDLEFTNLDEIDRLQASMDGQALPQGTQAGQVEIVAGKPLKVTWHFPPTSDASREFTLVYRVQGALRKNNDSDALIWRAIPEEHEYTIANSTIRLQYPPGVNPLQAPNLSMTPVVVETGDQSITFAIQGIQDDTPVDLTANFPPSSLLTQAPVWQARQAERTRRTAEALPYGFGAAAITGLISLVAVALYGQSFRRERDAASDFVPSYIAPPKTVAPAVAARLSGASYPFLGTLFDLAGRGVLSIEEGARKWGSRTFEVMRHSNDQDLTPHEQAFMQAFFRKAKGERVALTEIAGLASNSTYSRALDDELARLGWRDNQRNARRNRFLVFAGLGLFAGLAILLAGLIFTAATADNGGTLVLTAILIGSGIALVSASLVGFIVTAVISPLSDEGLRQAAAWKSFQSHLVGITRQREPVIAPDIFERYLAYAASFGVATQWVKFFSKVKDVPVPAWFTGLQTSLQDGSFAAIIAAISAADSSAASAAGAGASGASGGGASGAG